VRHPAARSRQDDDSAPGEQGRRPYEGQYPSRNASARLSGGLRARGLPCALRCRCWPRLLGRSLAAEGFAARSLAARSFAARSLASGRFAAGSASADRGGFGPGWLSVRGLLAGKPLARRPAGPFLAGRWSGHHLPASRRPAGSLLARRLNATGLAAALPARAGLAGLYPCRLAARTAGVCGAVLAALAPARSRPLVIRADQNAAARAGCRGRGAARAGIGVLRWPVPGVGEPRPPIARISRCRTVTRIGTFRRPVPRISEPRPAVIRISELRPPVCRIGKL
jgi:hypothetical protein